MTKDGNSLLIKLMAGSDVKLHAMLLYLLIYFMLNYMKLIMINFNEIKMLVNIYKQTTDCKCMPLLFILDFIPLKDLDKHTPYQHWRI